ncbi:MAG TPA: 50S ribosomal protein L32 [bacterium]|nr:50S ribosomal protein L32 [bacterium]
MGNPKRRHSKTRGRLRRTHWKMETPNASACPQCGTPRQPHRICPNCGTYKGKEVIAQKSE